MSDVVSWLQDNNWIFLVLAIINWSVVAFTWSVYFKRRKELCSSVKPGAVEDKEAHNKMCKRGG